MKKSILANNISGLTANILQNIFLSVFFVMLARAIGPEDFSAYVLGNSLYQVVGALSTFGLSNYFIREYAGGNADNSRLTIQFLCVEMILSVVAYVVLGVLSFSLYAGHVAIIWISLILGVNILFDNVIYCVKAIHIAERTQYRFIRVVLLEAFLKLVLVVFFYLLPFDFWLFLWVLTVYRCLTLVIAWRSVPPHRRMAVPSIRSLRASINFAAIKRILHAGKVFVIIGAVNIIFWRANVLILSKMAEQKTAAFYEVAFKFFAIAQIIPVIVLGTVYPLLSQYYVSDRNKFLEIAEKSFKQMLLFSTLVTLLAYFLAPLLIPYFLGDAYAETARMTQHMFFTLIPFSLSLVQAYVLVASKNEKTDMWLNLLNLMTNCVLAVVLIRYTGPTGSITAVTVSFSLFFLLQQYFLYRKGLSFWKPVARPFYGLLFIVCISILLTYREWMPFLLLPALAALAIVAYRMGILNRSIFIKE
jgi:O-antigen/teichoic acid export membrane protein